MAKNNPENKEIKETDEVIESTEKIKEVAKSVSEVKEKVIEPVLIEDSKVYKAEVISRFGKLAPGSTIEKKGSIIKVLLDKNLIKLI